MSIYNIKANRLLFCFLQGSELFKGFYEIWKVVEKYLQNILTGFLALRTEIY